MKKVLFTTLFAAGLVLASCGSNKTEGDSATGDSMAQDSTGMAPAAPSNDTAPSDTAAPMNDTLTPAP